MDDAPPRSTDRPLLAGTRGSPLARVQTAMVIGLLAPGTAVEERIIRTTGDAVQDRPLAEIGGKGLFSKEIHEALLDGRIDLAVHSLKDLETELPAGVVLACTLAREDPRDALLLAPGAEPEGAGLEALTRGAVVGTTSTRRQAQLLHARPDLRIVLMRGNVQTRLGKLADGVCDATLLAVAGLRRLGIDPPHVALAPEVMLPASCQGIIGVTARAGDTALLERLAAIEDRSARVAADAERALLGALDGSCRTPIGAHAVVEGGRVALAGLVARADGSFLVRRSAQGLAADAARLGAELGARLRAEAPADLFA